MNSSILRTALAGVALTACTQAQVVLNEVSYDAAGGDEGFVFVEIFGPAGFDVSGYQIVGYEGLGASAGMIQGATADQFTFPAGSLIPIDGLFVVADGDVDGGVTSVAGADFVDGDLDLENGPDAVVLVDALGNVVDAVCYGADTSMLPALALDGPAAGQAWFEGNSVRDFFGPLSLQRCPDGVDTNDNSADFSPGTPSPGVLNGLFCAAHVQNGLNGASFNSLSFGAGEALGFETFTSFGGPNMSRGGLPQIMLLSLTDPGLVAPLPGFSIPLDASTGPLLTAANTPIFAMFFIPALPSNNVEGNVIQFDAGQLVPPISGLPITFYAGFTVLGGTTGFIPSSNFGSFTLTM